MRSCARPRSKACSSIACARGRAQAPLVLVLEDCHWLDPLSRDLLEVLARAIAGLRVLLVLAYRPSTDVGGGLGIENLPHFDEIALAELDDQHAAQLIRSKLEQMLGADAEAPAALVDLVTARAQGNPVLHRGAAQLHPQPGRRPAGRGGAEEARAAREPAQPDPEPHRQARRGAAAHAQGGERARTRVPRADAAGRLPRARRLRRRSRSSCARSARAISSTSTRKPSRRTCSSTSSRRRSRTRACRSRSGRCCTSASAATSRQTEADAIDRHLDLLAHHYWHSENLPKKREYLGRAGDAAQASYANAAAIDYFERLAPLVEQGARVDVLLKLGKVLELVGNWHRAEQVDSEALALAESLGDDHSRASCETALAEVARKQGRYDEAFERLDRAARGFAVARRRKRRRKGAASRRHRGGAARRLREGGRELRGESRDPRANRRQGEHGQPAVESRRHRRVSRRLRRARARFHERALALRTEIGDRGRIGISMNNLGMIAVLQKRYEEARDWFEQSMLLNREVGDTWMVAHLPQQPRQRDARPRRLRDGAPALRRQPARLPRLRRPVGACVPARGHRHTRRAGRRRAIGARADRRRRRVARGDRRAPRPVARAGDRAAARAGDGGAVRGGTRWRTARAGGRSISPPQSTMPSRSASGRGGTNRQGSARTHCSEQKIDRAIPVATIA